MRERNASSSDSDDCFDFKKFVIARTRRKKEELIKTREIIEQCGDDLPLEVFNPIYVWATIEALLDIFEQHPEAYGALTDKLRNPDVPISAEHIEQIVAHSGALRQQRDGVYVVDHITRALFREAEQFKEGFDGFIKKALAKRKQWKEFRI